MGLRYRPRRELTESLNEADSVETDILTSGTSVSSVDLITLGLLALQAGFVLMMIVYLISGLDDLFIDLLFFVMKIEQWFGRDSKRHQPNREEMAEKPEQPFALMFPAWQES